METATPTAGSINGRMCFWLSPYLFPTQQWENGFLFPQGFAPQYKQGEQTYVNLVTVVLGSKVTNVAGRSGSAAGLRGFQLSHSHASWEPSGRLDLLGGFSGYSLVWEAIFISLSEA